MRKLCIAALFCCSAAAASSAKALDWQAYPYYDIVFSVDGWPRMGPRPDGKIDAGHFGFTTQASQSASTGRSTVQTFELRVPLGDPAVLFLRDALEGKTLKTVLVEGFMQNVPRAGPKAPAPFAVRLSDVRVSAVSMQMAYGEALVSLQASRIEVFTANQTATGTMQPGQQFGWDYRAGKKM